jgi:hypothetical protein
MTTKQDPEADAQYFVLEEFALTDPGQQRVERTILLSGYETMVSARLPGAKRLFTCGAMSGDPSSFAQLWSMPKKTYSPADLDAKLPEVRRAALGTYLPDGSTPTQAVLEPTAYSPGMAGRGGEDPIAPLDQIARLIPQYRGDVERASQRFLDQPSFTRAVGAPPADAGAAPSPAQPAQVFNDPRTTPVVLIVHARVKERERDAFVHWKEHFFKSFVATRGHWYLYAAGWKITDGSVAVNCWALETAQDLLKIMMLLSENSIYQGKLRPTIRSESQSLYWLDWDARDYSPYAHG